MKYVINFVSEMFESLYNNNHTDKIKIKTRKYNNKEKLLILGIRLKRKKYDVLMDFKINKGYVKNNDETILWEGKQEEIIDYINHMLNIDDNE